MINDDTKADLFIQKKTADYLWKIGNLLSSTPAASRFYMFNVRKRLLRNPEIMKNEADATHSFCSYCGTIWSPGNYRVRNQPRPKINAHLKKLIKLEVNKPWQLNSNQKRKLRKFRESTSKLVYTCFICKRKLKFPGSKKNTFRYRHNVAFSTPLLKIKRKKSDLNAGLFIPSPSVMDPNESLDKSSEISYSICDKTSLKKDSIQSASPVNVKQITMKKSPAINRDLLNTVVKTPVNINPKILQSTSSSKKQKKKSLLEEIKKQEHNQKKIGLAAFLTSL